MAGSASPARSNVLFLLAGAREIRMDFEAIHIANDHQRRVFQRFPIELQLLVGRLEILVLSLVFPGEMIPHPDVGPALLVFTG